MMKKSFAEIFAYCCMGLSVLLFLISILTYDAPSEWENNRIGNFMKYSFICYIILASFCFGATLITANSRDYKTATLFGLIPTIVSFCFMLFGFACYNNSVAWLLVFVASLGIFPAIYVDSSIKKQNYSTDKTKRETS